MILRPAPRLDERRGTDLARLCGVRGTAPNADRDEAKSAYRTLAMGCHPDRSGGSDTRFREINQAYATLVDPVQRAAYDARCAQARAATRHRMAAAAGT